MGGCTENEYYANQFQHCGGSCPCGLSCLNGVCQTPCAKTADCPDTGALCVFGLCSIHRCNRHDDTGTPEGRFQPCDATATGSQDGTCLPYNAFGEEEDICIVRGNGQPGATCDINVVRSNAAGGCVAGGVCGVDGVTGILASSEITFGVCAPGCDPTVSPDPCPVGTVCEHGDPGLDHLGFCQ
jgi:hypothetical protein